MFIQDEKFYDWNQTGENFFFFFFLVSLKWVKLKGRKHAANSLGGKEENGGFNCNIAFG